MHQLRQEAVFADDPIRSIARIVLQTLALDGCDPSLPLFELGRIPKPVMTCSNRAARQPRRVGHQTKGAPP
jgi:hypothetical protein